MKKILIFFFAVLWLQQAVNSQKPMSSGSNHSSGEANIHNHHTHEGHSHSVNEHQHNWEIGFAAGWVRLLTEKENAPGFHLHVLRNIGESGRFSMGPGIEFIADEHKHIATVMSLGYRPIHPLYIGVSPGIAFPLDPHAEHSEPSFSAHLEALYEIEFSFFHLGPMMEYSWGKEDRHFMVGLHIGLHF